jgi:hypothetical protein
MRWVTDIHIGWLAAELVFLVLDTLASYDLLFGW